MDEVYVGGGIKEEEREKRKFVSVNIMEFSRLRG
jgi:hypothetical protein